MAQLAKWSEAELAALHGLGPKGIRILKAGLAKERRHFRPVSERDRTPAVNGG